MNASFFHHGWRMPHAFLAQVCVTALLLLLSAGVLLGLAHTSRDVVDLVRQDHALLAAVGWVGPSWLAVTSFAGAWWLGRRPQPIPIPLFIAILVVSTLALRWILIGYVEPTWNTDYLRYWQRAMEMAADGEASASNIYRQRALLIPYPVELLFGPSATTALKWTNALLLLLVQLAAYDMMRVTFNHQAAQASSLVLLASPLPAYSALIPSHDLWALAFIAGAIWAAVRTWDLPRARLPRLASIIGLGVACAAFAYGLELQRSIGRLLCIALLVASILQLPIQRLHRSQSNAGPGSALLAVAVIALTLQPLFAMGVGAMGIRPVSSDGPDASAAMKYAAHGSAMGTGRSAWYARFNDRFRDKSEASPEQAMDFAKSVVLSTWTVQPLGKLDAIREHAGRLFSLSYPPDWDTLLRQPKGLSKDVRSALVMHVGVFGLLLLASTLGALVVLCIEPSRVTFPVLSTAVLVAGVALVMLVLFENKPFNISPVWLLYPLILGCASARRQPDQTLLAQRPIGASMLRIGLATSAFIGGGLALWFCLYSSYGINNGRVLDRWQLQLQQSQPSASHWEQMLTQEPPRAFEPKFYVYDQRGFVLRDAADDAARIQSRSDRLYLALRFPPGPIATGDRLSAESEVCLDGSRRTFEFFMFAPYLRRGVENAFTVEIAIDGQVVKQRPIPHRDRSDSMQLASVALPPAQEGACRTLSVTLVSNVDRTTTSWANASHTEIWYPRLVP